MEHFNQAELLENAMNNVDLYEELIHLATITLGEYKSDLKNAYQNNNFQLLKETAHAIKGLALTMHCGLMRQMAYDLELTACSNLSDEEISRKIDGISSEIDLLLDTYFINNS